MSDEQVPVVQADLKPGGVSLGGRGYWAVALAALGVSVTQIVVSQILGINLFTTTGISLFVSGTAFGFAVMEGRVTDALGRVLQAQKEVDRIARQKARLEDALIPNRLSSEGPLKLPSGDR